MKSLLDQMPFIRPGLIGALLIAGLAPVGAPAQATEAKELAGADATVVSEPADEPECERPIRARQPREVVQLGGTVEIGTGEEVRDVVAIFGEVNVRGTVRGDVVVVFGRATVDGEVQGSVVMPFSRLELGPTSRIGRDLVVVLGGLTAHPAAQIGGQRIDLSLTLLEERLPALEGVKLWLTQGLLFARPLPHQAGWWWWAALACAVLYFLTALVFARPLAVSVEAIETRPVASFLLGLLVLVLTGPLLLMLAATGIGLIVVPFVVAALMVAFLFGKIAVYQFLGRELGRQLGSKLLTIPLVALLIGVAIFFLVYMVPVVGLLAWSVTGLLGVGAATIACFSAFRMEPAPPPGPALARGTQVGSGAPVAVPVQPSVEPPVSMAPAPDPMQKPALEPKPASAVGAGAEIPPPIPGQKPVPAWIDVTSLPRVGFWPRFWATLIDLLLIGVLVAWLDRVPWFIPVWVGYHVAMWAWRGTTIGGIVFGLRIAKIDGRPIDFPIALIRALSSFLSAVVLFLGFFWASWTREKRAWHDLIADTMIVQMPRGVSPL